MEKTSIGLLLPLSNIMPMSKQYEKGLYKGLEKKGIDVSEIEFVKEIIGQGSYEQTEKAVEKLMVYDGVDFVSGILSSAVSREFSEKFKKKKRGAVISNLGEYILPKEHDHKYFKTNSVDLWKQCWLLGKWAGQALGKKYMVSGALYDCGYAFQMMVDYGVRYVTTDSELRFAICPMPLKGETSDIDSTIDKIEADKPDFVLALFCGEEATMFLEKYKERGLSAIPIVGLPFLLEAGEKALEGITIYTPHYLSSKEELSPRYEHVFYQLGEKAGQRLAKEMNGNGEEEETWDTELEQEAMILKNTFGEQNVLQTEIVHIETFDLKDDQEFVQMSGVLSSGWVNPYLGI